MEELHPEGLEQLIEELEEEYGADELLPPEVENLLKDLQRPGLWIVRLNAAENLGKLGESHLRIVQALMAVAESDSNQEVRAAALESLGAPVHQQVLQEHPSLTQRAPSAVKQAVMEKTEGQRAVDHGRRAEKAEGPMPKNVTCEKTPAGLTLAWRWISGGDILGLVFSVFWYGVILAVYTITTLSYLGFLSMSGPRWLLYLILLPFLWLPRKLAYGSIAGILNRTVIQVTSSQLSIEHKPLPWPGNRSLPVSDLRQLYCRKVGDVRKDQSITYSLLATLKGGQEIELLKGIESPETVQYLEQEIEAWLGIEDTAVANEMAG